WYVDACDFFCCFVFFLFSAYICSCRRCFDGGESSVGSGNHAEPNHWVGKRSAQSLEYAIYFRMFYWRCFRRCIRVGSLALEWMGRGLCGGLCYSGYSDAGVFSVIKEYFLRWILLKMGKC